VARPLTSSRPAVQYANMKLALLLLLGLAGLAGCTDLQRTAYQDSRSINKYSRQNMRETEQDIPLPRIRPPGVPRYANYDYTPRSPYSPYANRQAFVSGDVVVPAYSPGLYGPVADPQYSAAMGPGFGGPRYRYAPRYYGTYGYYPAYGWGY
jgi:hypothetical protein